MKMPKQLTMHKLFLILILLVLIPLHENCPQDQGLKKVTLLPSWVPQQQFAGYYMAKEKGIYKKYGLDVTILTGGYSHKVTTSLEKGEADFGIMFLYSGVLERAKGMKLVNISQVFQRSAIMFVARKSSGIKSLNDFNGRKIGIWRATESELTTGFLKIHNIVGEIIPFDKGINLFLDGAVDITVMMEYNEFSHMINSGINEDEVNKFYFYNYRMNFPEDGIYCMESTYNNDPELCRKFVDASIEGWNYALENIDETINVMNKYQVKAIVPHNRSHSLWMLNSMKDMIFSSGKKVKQGSLLESDYNHLTDFLMENDFITSRPGYSDFYKGSR
jgi:NitT/TauT family transport system substrate-binding protein